MCHVTDAPLTPLGLDHGADEGHQETRELGYPQGKDLPEPSTCAMSLTPPLTLLDLDHGTDNMPMHTHQGKHTAQQWGHNVGQQRHNGDMMGWPGMQWEGYDRDNGDVMKGM